MTITWDTASGVDGYVLEAGSRPGLSDIASLPIGAPGYVADGVVSGTYYLRVRAIAAGVMSGPSGEIAIGRALTAGDQRLRVHCKISRSAGL